MNARFAHVFSRLSIVSVVAVSGLSVAACSRAPTTSTEAAPAAQAAAEQAPAEQATASRHVPGQWLFRQVEALDLRPEQRAAIADIKQNLVADMEPHRETVRQLAQSLAQAVEDGHIDPAEAAAHQEALSATLADVKVAFATAINGVHDVLDAGQRATLVANLEAMRQHRHTRANGAEHQGGLAKLAFELGLSEEQKATLHEAMQKGLDEIFPDRAAHREAMEARMKAMREAFVTDDFDAADHDLGSDAERTLGSFIAISSRAIEISGQVLSDGQRLAAADMIRAHAEKL